MFCNTFPSSPSKLHFFLIKILGKVLNFIIPTYPDVIKVGLAKKFRFDIIPLANIADEKSWSGSFSTPWCPKQNQSEALSHLTYLGMSVRDSKIYPKSIVKFLSEDPKVSEGSIDSFQNGTKVRTNVWCIWIWVYSDLFGIITIVFPC